MMVALFLIVNVNFRSRLEGRGLNVFRKMNIDLSFDSSRILCRRAFGDFGIY